MGEGIMFKPASYSENQEGFSGPLIGIHFHFRVILNVKNRANEECFEYAQGDLSLWVESILWNEGRLWQGTL